MSFLKQIVSEKAEENIKETFLENIFCSPRISYAKLSEIYEQAYNNSGSFNPIAWAKSQVFKYINEHSRLVEYVDIKDLTPDSSLHEIISALQHRFNADSKWYDNEVSQNSIPPDSYSPELKLEQNIQELVERKIINPEMADSLYKSVATSYNNNDQQNEGAIQPFYHEIFQKLFRQFIDANDNFDQGGDYPELDLKHNIEHLIAKHVISSQQGHKLFDEIINQYYKKFKQQPDIHNNNNMDEEAPSVVKKRFSQYFRKQHNEGKEERPDASLECPHCKGKGCKDCDYSGRKVLESNMIDSEYFRIWDRIDKVWVGKKSKNKRTLRRAADKRDMQYGAYRYTVRPYDPKKD